MASGKSTESLRVDLPLWMHCKNGEISDIGKRDVAKDLNLYQGIIRGRLKEIKELSSFVIVDFRFSNGVVYLSLDVSNEEQLETIYDCLKNGKNEFSEWLSKFMIDKSIELSAGLHLNTAITCNISMPTNIYLQCRLTFYTLEEAKRNANGTGNDQPERNLANVGIVGQQVKQIEEKSSSLPLGSTDTASNQRQPGGYPHDTKRHSSENEKMITKTFRLYYPLTKGWKIKKMEIESDNRYLNSDMKQHSENIYEYTVDIPDKNANSSYHYICHLKSESILNVKDKVMGTPARKSRKYYLDSNSFQRDSWLEHGMKILHDPHKYDEECLTAHLVDILFHCEANIDLKDACCQIEELCVRKLPRMNAKQLLRQIEIGLPSGTKKTRLLLIVVIGNIVTSRQPITQGEIFEQSTVKSILQNLKHFRTNDLPDSCRNYLYKVCFALCLNIYGPNMCQVEYLNTCCPFYDDAFILQRLQSLVEGGTHIAHDRRALDDCALKLCRKMYNISKVESSINALKCLDILLRHFPFDMTLFVVSEMSVKTTNMQPDEVDLQNILNVALRVRIEIALRTFKKNKNIQELNDLWKKISQNGKANEESQKKVEETLCSILESFPSSSNCPADAVIEFMEEFGFFIERSDRQKLLQIIIETSNFSVLELFFKFACCKKMEEVYKSVQKDDFQIFSLKYLSGNVSFRTERSQEFECFLGRFCRLLDLTQFIQMGDLNDILEATLLRELEKYRPKELLKFLTTIDKVLEGKKEIATLFIGHFETIVKDSSERPEVLLEYITDKSGKAQVETRLSARLVCTMLESYGVNTEKYTDFENFLHLVSHYEFWILVFKCTGKCIDIVHMNNMYKEAWACISRMGQLFGNHEVHYEFVQRLHGNKQYTIAAKKLLALELERSDIERFWSDALNKFKVVKDKLRISYEVLTHVKQKSQQASVDFDSVLTRICDNEKRFVSGMITANECHNDIGIWKGLEQLPKICENIRNVVPSSVFWNISSECVNQTYLHKCEMFNEDDPLSSLRELFQESYDCDKTYDNNNNDCILYMQILQNVGLTEYSDKWKSLMKDETFQMEQVLKMFGSTPDISKEIEIAKSYSHIIIDEDIEESLHNIFSIETVKRTVDAIESVVRVFDLKWKEDLVYAKSIESFRKLLLGSAEEYTFKAVKLALNTVFAMVKNISDDTISVMTVLGRSSTLITFLRDILDEDIKNLIDAVEDISEQQVRESTVSALIEVKQFLHPLLISKDVQYINEFFQTLEKQTNLSRTGSASLPTKIEDCIQNLHNLKSLYNGVANRGEQTKEMIKNIIQKGSFTFQLNKMKSYTTFEASYKQNKVKENRKRSTLIDLRSRALLLMNSDKKSAKENRYNRDELMKFVDDIDICLEIAETLFALHSSGHTDHMTVKEVVKPDNLPKKKKELAICLDLWLQDINEERDVHYLMNFIKGSQIHILYQYLEENNRNKYAVQTILTFIHPEMKAEKLKEMYEKEKSIKDVWSKRSMLHCVGFSLHKLYEGLQMFQRSIKKSQRSKSMKDMVLPGRLTIAQLDEWSLLTIRTILALYINTTQMLAEPNHILFCTRETDWTELELLIRRCLGSMEFYKEKVLFCIANVENLPNELQFKLVATLRHLPKASKFHLAVICKGSRNHPFIDELSDCTSSVTPVTDKTVRDIFEEHCTNVVSVSSTFPGLGKTSFIAKKAHRQRRGMVTLHISGFVRKFSLVHRINDLHVKEHHILHIDLGNVESPSELDTFLFELVVLRYVSAGTLSVCLQTSRVYIEIGNTINDTLRNALQTTVLFTRKEIEWNGINDLSVSRELNSPVQVVCHYLHYLENGSIDKKDVCFDGKAEKPLSSKRCKWLLQKYIGGKLNTSFPTIFTFVNVLADQLKKMSQSSFFKTNRLVDMIGNKVKLSVKSQLLKAMIDVSCDFSTRSVEICRKSQISTIQDDNKQADLASSVTHQIDSMIRWEDSNHLMFLFHNQNIHTLSAFYRNLSMVPREIRTLFESQMKKSMEDFKTMDQGNLQTMLQKVARTNPLPLPQNQLLELSKDYALTADNLLKMVLIMLRLKANIPIVIMGETGCGKTSLIRYLAAICEINFEVLNIHAGVKEEDIVAKVLKNNAEALEQIDKDRWLFLDEINTSDSIGVISDIICHHRCVGTELSPNLTIMGACNPYKLRTIKAISTAGLEGKVKSDELSRLVYRVLPLPELMIDYVWDFGSLNEKDEETYIHRMIYDVFDGNEKHQHLFTNLLAFSQSFVRRHEETSYSVSLRDIHRCKILMKWFLKVLPKKETPLNATFDWDKLSIRSMILTLAHCYQSRFAEKKLRKEYRCKIGEVFKLNGYQFSGKQDHFIQTVIKEEQSDILRRMKLPPGTARNMALQENVFVILVCIFNRIPIFVVGKPGCSKSLAMQLIKSNLRGKDSEDDFFKELPQVYCVSFQGSESSTSDGIIKVFEKAKNYQDSNNIEEVLSVVILDEIGLAEVSRFNPLKVLHNLLEPDGASRPNVAVVGISNWALDASKMNRAIHLSRTDMDEEELFDTALSISESFLGSDNRQSLFKTNFELGKDTSLEDIKPELYGMANAYFQYINELRFKNFHGLRDYYSLIKFVARMFAEKNYKCSVEDKTEIITDGIARNFGGLPDEVQTLYAIFQRNLNIIMFMEKPQMNLITENIKDPIARHLMLITTGESALGIIEHNLKDIGCDRKEVIFGSQFEEDLTDDYNYRILSKIILCMEEGVVLILKDLESIYGSLYDMLNQNYTMIGKKKNCRIALGPYSNPICHVADSFRCIVLTDESKVDLTDPPFLNRFEKQYLKFFDIIKKRHIPIIEQLKCWINDLSETEEGEIEKEELFPIRSKDLMESLVLKIESEFGNEFEFGCFETIFTTSKERLMWIIKPEILVRQRSSKSMNVQKCLNELTRQYFSLPIHNGLEHYIVQQTETTETEELDRGLLNILFTNSNVHTKMTFSCENLKVQVEKLGTFKSEKQLSARIQTYWDAPDSNILLIHCNAKDDERHILLTKLVIERCRTEYIAKSDTIAKHVYLIIHLDRSKASPHCVSQLNFLSEWKLVMMDSLEIPSISLPHLFRLTLQEAIQEKRPLRLRIREELFWAFSRIRYGNFGRDIGSISMAISKIEESFELMDIIEKEIITYTDKTFSGKQNKYWLTEVACDVTALTSSSSFIDALDSYVTSKIKIPLAKFIYEVEQTGILESYFQIDNSTCAEMISNKSKMLSWISGINNRRVFSIDGVPDETGPECYTCDTADFALGMPFSKNVYDRMESTKDEFMEMVQRYRLQCLLNEDEELPSDVYEAVFHQQEQSILKIIPDLSEFTYKEWENDYLMDFCNMSSHIILIDSSKSKRAQFLALILERIGMELIEDPFLFILRLHTTLWVHYTSIHAEMGLIDKCLTVMPESKDDIIRNLHQFIKCPIFSMENKGIEQTEELRNITEQIAEIDTKYKAEQSIQNETVKKEELEEIPSQDICSIEANYLFDESDIVLSDSSGVLNVDSVALEMSDTVSLSSIKEFSYADQTECSGSLQKVANSTNIYQVETENGNGETYRQNLLKIVCKAMLPTVDCLKYYKGIRHWLEEVTSTVSLAAMVSRSPAILYSVRVCIEIASQVIIPLDLNTDILENIGASISNNALIDSNAIFTLIVNLIEYALSVQHETSEDVNTICQRFLSSYFIRCLSADPETNAYKFLWMLTLERKIPNKHTTFYKVPLGMFMEVLDGEFLTTILSEENLAQFLSLENDMEDSFDGCALEYYESLDNCVRTMLLDNRFEDPFIVLIEDILQESIEMDIRSSNSRLAETEEDALNEKTTYGLNQRLIELFYSCHKAIKRHEPGLKYIASIAFCKGFTSNALILLENSSNEEQENILRTLDVVLSDLPGKVAHPFALYFLKQQLKGISLSKLLCKYDTNTTFMQSFNWDNKATINDFGKSPLCSYMTEMEHNDSCLNSKSLGVTEFRATVGNLVSKSCASRCEMLKLLSFVLREFYLQLADKDLDDTQHSQAKLILNEVMGSSICNETKLFVKCILGEQNFTTKDFLLTNASSHTHACKASFLVSLYSLLLAHKESKVQPHDTESRQMPFFIRCLLLEKSILSCFIPGVPDELSDSSSEISESSDKGNVCYLGLCKCGYRIAFAKHSGPNITCSVCKQSISCSAQLGRANSTARISNWKDLKICDVHTCKWINPVTSNILQLLLKGCLLGSLAVGFSSESDLECSLNLQEGDVADILSQGVNHHWNILKELLNVDDYTLVALLHVTLLKTSNHLFDASYDFQNIEATIKWEEIFDSMLKTILETRYDKVRTLYQHHNRIHNGENMSLTMCLLESEDENSITPKSKLVYLPALYRIRACSNKDNFMYELHYVQNKFPLLTAVIEQEQDLKLPEHILNFVQWHAATVANASYMLKSHDCSTMSVQDFIYFKQNTMKKDVMKQRFEAFRKTWEQLMVLLQKDPIAKQMKRIHSESKISDCLILNKHSLPLRILQRLIDTQNTFLDTVLLNSFNCNSLAMFRRENMYALPCVKITDVKKEQLVCSEIDWETLLQQESNCDLKYSCGRQIKYDFCSIEEAVSREMIFGKCYIILENTLPEIVFIDELHKNYGNLIRELRQGVSQQPLPADIRSGILCRKAEDPRMSNELLTHLGIVMTLLKKTNVDTDLALVDYVDQWKSVLCRDFPKKLLPSPETGVKVCHVVALSELLEELCAESIKEGLDDVYRDMLDGPLRDHIFLQLKDDTLSSVLFKAVKRFTYRCLTSRIADSKQSLRLYLSDESFWPMEVFQDNILIIGEKQVDIKDVLPDGLMVRHIFEYYELIESEMEQKRQGHLKMSGFAINFQAKAKMTLPSRKEQKKKRTTNIRKF